MKPTSPTGELTDSGNQKDCHYKKNNDRVYEGVWWCKTQTDRAIFGEVLLLAGDKSVSKEKNIINQPRNPILTAGCGGIKNKSL